MTADRLVLFIAGLLIGALVTILAVVLLRALDYKRTLRQINAGERRKL